MGLFVLGVAAIVIGLAIAIIGHLYHAGLDAVLRLPIPVQWEPGPPKKGVPTREEVLEHLEHLNTLMTPTPPPGPPPPWTPGYEVAGTKIGEWKVDKYWTGIACNRCHKDGHTVLVRSGATVCPRCGSGHLRNCTTRWMEHPKKGGRWEFVSWR